MSFSRNQTFYICQKTFNMFKNIALFCRHKNQNCTVFWAFWCGYISYTVNSIGEKTHCSSEHHADSIVNTTLKPNNHQQRQVPSSQPSQWIRSNDKMHNHLLQTQNVKIPKAIKRAYNTCTRPIMINIFVISWLCVHKINFNCISATYYVNYNLNNTSTHNTTCSIIRAIKTSIVIDVFV